MAGWKDGSMDDGGPEGHTDGWMDGQMFKFSVAEWLRWLANLGVTTTTE